MVVNAPNSPVPRNKMVSVSTEEFAEDINAPSRSAPSRFTKTVAQGTSALLLVGIASEIAHRATDPIAPPRPTSRAGCMVLARTGGA